MSHELVHARVLEHLGRLRLGHLAERLDALLSEAARGEPTYLDFLDALLREEVGAKQKKRVAMGIQRPPVMLAKRMLQPATLTAKHDRRLGRRDAPLQLWQVHEGLRGHGALWRMATRDVRLTISCGRQWRSGAGVPPVRPGPGRWRAPRWTVPRSIRRQRSS